MEVHRECAFQMTVFRSYLRWKVPTLFKMADSGDWEKIPVRVARHPSEAKFVHKYAPGDTALHRLVRPLTSTTSVGTAMDDREVDKVISSSEETSVASTATQDDPFADAREVSLSMDEETRMSQVLVPAVEAILQVYTEASTVQDASFGRTPLHLACQSLTPHRVEVVKVLLRHSRSRNLPLLLQDCRGRTPLHYLVENNNNLNATAMLDLVQAFVESDRERALRLADANGKTVLDLAAERGQEEDVVPYNGETTGNSSSVLAFLRGQAQVKTGLVAF